MTTLTLEDANLDGIQEDGGSYYQCESAGSLFESGRNAAETNTKKVGE